MNRKFNSCLFISLLSVIVIISTISIEVLSNRHQTSMIQAKQQKANERLSSFRYKLEARILSDIYVAKTLATLTTVNTSPIEKNWDSVARDIMSQSRDIRSLALAPNDIIQYVYPYEPNKKVIGVNFRQIPEQWITVKKARDIKKVYLAGPVDLIQGGVGLVARYPVFLDPPDNQFYWGVISAVLDIQKLFRETGLERLKKEYDVSIRGKNSKGAAGDVFVGEVSTFSTPLAQESVYFPYGSWVVALSAKPEELGFSNWIKANSVRLVGYPILLILMLVITVMYYLYQMARRASLYDELTQLPNRRYFMQTLDRIFTKNQLKDRRKTFFALINVDLNNFKQINDQYGHHAGDSVLQQTAKHIVHSVKPDDFVARIGGDEFLIIVLNVHSEAEVRQKIETVRNHLCGETLIVDNSQLNVSASIGFSLYSSEFTDYEDMILQADARMYSEKKQRD
ncbi:diguanylate cyclase domain-containing protein [Vibrio salinus]|uniref:diguanylate cyclase domain-containing protein n=1 Tax=Vibrio salinus TaxID=2899784 RepID=UPI001E55BE67|nr:diguanylate cyclase [Vibrio salinus]MCE0494934.1 sensor domain-containing diguanylate cyclase [Vibrio salinus]